MRPPEFSASGPDTPPSIEMKPEEVQFAARIITALRQSGISIKKAQKLLDPHLLKKLFPDSPQAKPANVRRTTRSSIEASTKVQSNARYMSIKQAITTKEPCEFSLDELITMTDVIVVRDISKPLFLPSAMITTRDGDQYDAYIDKPQPGKITLLLNTDQLS